MVDYFVDERANDGVRFLDVNDFAALEERFSIVLASAVLEHLVDLAWTTRKLLSLCIEGGAFYARAPRVLRVALTFVIVVFGWVLFRAPSLGHALRYAATMVGLG